MEFAIIKSRIRFSETMNFVFVLQVLRFSILRAATQSVKVEFKALHLLCASIDGHVCLYILHVCLYYSYLNRYRCCNNCIKISMLRTSPLEFNCNHLLFETKYANNLLPNIIYAQCRCAEWTDGLDFQCKTHRSNHLFSFRELQELILKCSDFGESNSALLVGPRGSGKSTVMLRNKFCI